MAILTAYIFVTRLGASLSILREKVTEAEEGYSEMRRALEILVRKVPDDQEVRAAAVSYLTYFMLC